MFPPNSNNDLRSVLAAHPDTCGLGGRTVGLKRIGFVVTPSLGIVLAPLAAEAQVPPEAAYRAVDLRRRARRAIPQAGTRARTPRIQ